MNKKTFDNIPLTPQQIEGKKKKSFLDRAAAYTKKCIEILVEDYGANKYEIAGDLFYLYAYNAFSHGRKPDVPDMRIRNLMMACKPELLGLGIDDK